MKNLSIWTIGHSSHSYEQFRMLLGQSDVTAIADVRSTPFSRHFPQFNMDTLKSALRHDGVAYSFLGKELGGRPRGNSFYFEGIANYELMAVAKEFGQGLQRVIEGARNYRIALMCSEHDPLDCHRCLLVGRALKEHELAVIHILSDGTHKTQAEIEEQLLAEIEIDQNQSDFFASPEERLSNAYRHRARRVAFSLPAAGRISATTSG